MRIFYPSCVEVMLHAIYAYDLLHKLCYMQYMRMIYSYNNNNNKLYFVNNVTYFTENTQKNNRQHIRQLGSKRVSWYRMFDHET